MSDEDTRAAAWRAQQVSRAKFIRDNEKRLRGSQSRRVQLEQQWAPVINRTQDPTEEPR
jgi:hypothetical protein